MSRVKLTPHINNIINRYSSMETIASIARDFGVPDSSIRRLLKRNGVGLRGKRITVDTDRIVELYNSGVSVLQLAKDFDVASTVINRRLAEAGVVTRGQTEANRLMMKSRTSEENARNVIAAHNAVRGKRRSTEELIKRAKTKESMTVFTSDFERAIAKELTDRGIDFTPQKAVYKYNIDIAIGDDIALEVFGGGWHGVGRHAARFTERSKYLFDAGYTVVICWTSFGEFTPTAIADYLIQLRDELRSNPSSARKHYVILGDGQLTTVGANNLDYVT